MTHVILTRGWTRQKRKIVHKTLEIKADADKL